MALQQAVDEAVMLCRPWGPSTEPAAALDAEFCIDEQFWIILGERLAWLERPQRLSQHMAGRALMATREDRDVISGRGSIPMPRFGLRPVPASVRYPICRELVGAWARSVTLGYPPGALPVRLPRR